MRLYIIRHGQTDWNIEKKIQGRQDIPLNERGRYQAECLSKAMKNQTCYCSIFQSSDPGDGNS